MMMKMRILHTLQSLGPRLLRPRTFLGIMSLQMGTEVISAMLFFNKLTGAYGLLAILTGFQLSVTQLSAYLYNLAILVLVAICIPHIRRETPLPNLALAWAYGIDTLINAAYTAAFALSWYLASSTAAAAAASTASPAATMVTNSTVISSPAATATSATSILATASATATAAADAFRRDDSTHASMSTRPSSAAPAESSTTYGGGGWMGAHETAASLTLIVIVTVVRFYFLFVVIAHTRQALQRYGDHVVESAAAADAALDDEDEDEDEDVSGDAVDDTAEREGAGDDEEAGLKSGKRSSRAGGSRRQQRSRRARAPHSRLRQPQGGAMAGLASNNPFAQGSPAGEGWRGRVGRALLGVGNNFWLGRVKDDNWAGRDGPSRYRSLASGPA